MNSRIAEMSRFDTDISEARTVATCAWCGCEIYVGDEVKRINDSSVGDDGEGYVHDGDCATRYADERVYDASGTIDNRGGIV